MEDMDRQVYDSVKSMFETLMLSTIDKAVNGGDWQTGCEKLIEVFNSQADSNLNMLRKLREKEAKLALTASCNCAMLSEQHKEQQQ